MDIVHSIVIGSATDLVPFVVGICIWERLSRELKILWIFFLLTVLTDVLVVYLAVNKMTNIWLFSIFTILEYGFLVYVFSCWEGRELVKRALQFSLIIFATIWLCLRLAGIPGAEIYYYGKLVESVVLVALSVHLLYTVNKSGVASLLKSAHFWFGSGVLLYFAGNVMLFALNIFIETRFISSFWLIHSGLNIVANLCYTGGFLSHYRFKACGSSASARPLSWPLS